MNSSDKHDYDSYSPEKITNDHLRTDRRALIFLGEPGIGKFTLAAQLILQLISRERHVSLLDAGPVRLP